MLAVNLGVHERRGEVVGGSQPTLLIMRNLSTTATPPFKSAVQNVASPSTIASTMGKYLPAVTYSDKAQFDKTGCTPSTR